MNMETPTESEDITAYKKIFTPSRSFLVKTLIVLVVVSAIVSVVDYRMNGNRFVKKGANEVFVTLGPAPLSTLYKVNLDMQTIQPVVVSGEENKNWQVMDAVTVANGAHYYLLSAKDKPGISNLYLQDESGALTKLTETETFKFGLSYDKKSGLVAYQSRTMLVEPVDLVKKPEWNIEVYNPTMKKSTVVGKGTRAYLLSGGTRLLIQTPDSLLLTMLAPAELQPIKGASLGSSTLRAQIAIQTNTATTTKSIKLLDLYANSKIAIDSMGTNIALYNSRTQAVDLYSFASGSLSYTKSIKVTAEPDVVGFLNGESFVANKISSKDASKLIFKILNEDSAVLIETPGELVSLQSILRVTPSSI